MIPVEKLYTRRIRNLALWTAIPFWGPFYLAGWILGLPVAAFRAGLRKWLH